MKLSKSGKYSIAIPLDLIAIIIVAIFYRVRQPKMIQEKAEIRELLIETAQALFKQRNKKRIKLSKAQVYAITSREMMEYYEEQTRFLIAAYFESRPNPTQTEDIKFLNHLN